jgi:hypothetical protein
MQYYKELDIDDFDAITNKTLTFVREQTTLLHKPISYNWYYAPFNKLVEHVPELKTAFIKYKGLTPIYVAFYVAWKITAIHRDAGSLSARINFPILNCKNTITNFYKNAVFKEYINLGTAVPSYSVSNTDYELVDSIEIKKATLLRVHEAHNVIVPKNFPVPRITMSVGFNKDPIFLFDN